MIERLYDLIDQREFVAATNLLASFRDSDPKLFSQIERDPDLLAHCARKT